MTTEITKPKAIEEMLLPPRHEPAGSKDTLPFGCHRGEEDSHYGSLAAIFGMIYDQALHLVGIIGADGALQYANPKACELIGKNSSELTGRPFWDTPWWTHSAAEQDKLREAFRRAVGGESVQFETTHVSADGRLHNMDFTLRTMRDTAGQIVCLIAESWNVTERKAAEQELEQAHLLLDAVLDQSPVPMVVARASDLVMIHCNRAATDILGVSDEERSVGLTLAEARKRQTWQDFDSDGKPVDLLDMPLARALRGKTTRDKEYSIIRSDGTQRWHLASSTPVYNRTGEITAGLITFPDITERKRTEEALRTSEAFLETIIENSPFSMWVSDAKGTLIRMNQACRDLLQVNDRDLVGKYNVLQDNIVEQQGVMPLVKRAFENGERSVLSSLMTAPDSGRFGLKRPPR
jgi:sigma-B regulation protein RsbU (phosphoserine phosphatase)